MATELKHNVMPSGGDFTSLSAAIDHIEASHSNLVTSDNYATIEIDGDWSSTTDDSVVTVHNITTDATRYISIYTTTTARHAGEYTTAKHVLSALSASGAGAINLYGSVYIRVAGLQLRWSPPSDATYRNGIVYQQSAYAMVSSCLFIINNADNGDSKGTALVPAPWAAGTLDVWNCAFKAAYLQQCKGIDEYVTGGGSYVKVYSCTFKNLQYGINQASGTVTAKNCGFANCTSAVGGTVAQTTCSTSTPTFDTGKDFHLASSDTTWQDQGTNTSGDASPLNFTDDIDGTTRSGTWDIGADEYVAAGGATLNFTVTDGYSHGDTSALSVTAQPDLAFTGTDGLSLSEAVALLPDRLSIAAIDSAAYSDESSAQLVGAAPGGPALFVGHGGITIE